MIKLKEYNAYFLPILLILVLFFIEVKLTAQYTKSVDINGAYLIGKSSKIKTQECSGLALAENIITPWFINIKNTQKKHSFEYSVDSIKSIKTKLKISSLNSNLTNNFSNSRGNNPLIGVNFKGNIFNGGAPPDNTIAVSDNGNIVSVINCNIAYYNSNGVMLWTGSFWELFNDKSLTEIIYDPIIVYDSQADRFIMTAIHGFTASKSKLIIAFSKTSNPIDGWWIYQLSGNPLENNCWLDYPKLGVSNNEIFITANLFNDFGGFSESVIYQITKNNGYNGSNLNWKLWSDIDGSPITLIPASYGQKGNYGPGLYFVNQSPGSGNSVNVYEITNEINANPKLVKKKIFKRDYSPSGNALQLSSQVQLITSDCRIINAFYLDENIHYVFQSDYQASNYSGLNYNRLDLKTLINSSFEFGMIGEDYSYPSVASFSNSSVDKSVIFCFLNSSQKIFPEVKTVVFDGIGNWSNSAVVKSGDNFVNAFEIDNTVRWGDYTGICYKYNPTEPEVWLSGCYGSQQTLFGTKYNCFNTWIGQVKNSSLNTSIIETNNSQLLINPNPIIDLFTLDFDIKETSIVKIEITDINGKIIKGLFNGTIKNGNNQLSFNRNALNNGIYFINLFKNNTLLIHKKIIVF
jgi:hypothetical protein